MITRLSMCTRAVREFGMYFTKKETPGSNKSIICVGQSVGYLISGGPNALARFSVIVSWFAVLPCPAPQAS